MKRSVLTRFGLMLAIVVVSPNCWAAVLQFDGGGDGTTFLGVGNWDAAGVPGPGDRGIINNAFAVTYGTAATTTVGSLIVGADWPVTGDTGSPGTLNMSAGKIIVSGGGDSFQISRACCASDGSAMNLTGAAVLEIGGSDPIVGTRDQGTLDVGGTASVIPTTVGGVYWRLGNYGPSFIGDLGGLQGNGLLNVHDNGSFKANVIFIGDNDATGELRVSDKGSVILTGNLVPRPAGFFPQGSATVRMTGSTATLSAFNLESESLPGEIRTKYRFDANPGGVSKITLTDAINITNNDLEVNLDGFVLPLLAKVVLFDGDQALVGNRIFGTFTNFTVNGVVNPPNFTVVYDQVKGDILLQRVPEPTTATLLGLGMVMTMFVAKRRGSR
jgi:hypothetical protein